MRHHKANPRNRGFTLIEAALTTTIVGVGVVAMMELISSGTMSNVKATELTTGLNLVRNVREAAIQKPYAELLAMNGQVHSPPIDSRSVGISEMTGWKQTIYVNAINPDQLTLKVIDPTPEAVMVRVEVKHNDVFVCDSSWTTFSSVVP